MKRTLLTAIMVLGTMVFSTGLQTANAELLTEDSADFSWKYEMDVDPITQDLDGNPGVDWKLLRGAIQVNGDGTVDLAELNGDYGCLISAGVGETTHYIPGGVWNNISDATGFTLELRVKTSGDYAWHGYTAGLYLLGVEGGESNKSVLAIMNEATIWDHTVRTVADSNANNDDFHMFRIAQEAGSSTYNIWRDGVLIHTGDGLQSNSWNRVQFGDLGVHGGPNVVDYFRLTTGAYAPAPVPEPSTLALLASGLIGLLAYAWRKRK